MPFYNLTIDSIVSFGNEYEGLLTLNCSIGNNSIKIRRNDIINISTGHIDKIPYTVIDPGVTEDLIGWIGWHIYYISRDNPKR